MINQVNTAIVQPQDVTKYIPHRAPLVMVDKLYMCSSRMGMAGLKVLHNNVFVAQNQLQETGLIEHMAQTLALKIAFERSLKSNEKFRGFLVVVRALNIFKRPKVGQEVITRAEVVPNHKDKNVARFSSFISGRLIAESEMKLFML